MTIIKLDAIDSTNDYLKQLAKEKELENYTIVMAKEQTNGKGQMGAKWFSEPGKNLTMSVLIKDITRHGHTVFDFNVAVALSLSKLLDLMGLADVCIKWPNDIMAGGKKLGGILIENIVKSDGTINAIVGIGLNANQTYFLGLPDAASISNFTGVQFEDIEELAKVVVVSLETFVAATQIDMEELWNQYNESLFRLDMPTQFEDKQGHRFVGTIKHVTREGKLALLQDDSRLRFYEAKEIKMLF